MHRLVALCILLAITSPSLGMVGGAQVVVDTKSRPEVMLIGSRGNFCTGVAIARDLVLSAAHCVQPGATYKHVELGAERQPIFKDIVSISRHPQFSLKAMLSHRATADIALVKLAVPLNVTPATLARPRARIAPGERFIVHGYGMSDPADANSSATLRHAMLAATGKPGNLQLRLVDPATDGTRAGLGACTGDSGGPVYGNDGGYMAVIGVVSWSTGPNGSAGCGGLTGVTPIELYRKWITEQAANMGSPLPR